MNPNWLNVKIYDGKAYPKKIYEIARKTGSDVDQIASIERIEPGAIIDAWIRRDRIEMIVMVQQVPDAPDELFVEFIDGSGVFLYDPKKKLVNKIDRFLKLQPDYSFKNMTVLREMDDEEIEEMGENYDKE